MSQTLADVERRCRYHLRDRNPQAEAFSSPEYVHAIDANLRIVASQLLLGEALVTALVTLVPGTAAYTLTVSAQTVQSIRELKLQSSGMPVQIVAEPVFEAQRQGDTATNISRGDPLIAMFRESAAQLPEVVFWPTPAKADAVDGYRSLLPARFFNAGSGTLTALPENTTIPLDDEGFNALSYVTAADLFTRMTDAERARLRLAPNASDGWMSKAATLIAASRKRRIVSKATDGGHRGGRRW